MQQINGILKLKAVNICCFKLMWLIARENLINVKVSSPKYLLLCLTLIIYSNK
jgi:hypothetical protein